MTPVADAAEVLVTPVAETTEAVLTPVTEVTEAVVTPVSEVAETVVTPVADAAEVLVTPVAETTEAVLTPVSDIVPAVAPPPVADVVGTIATPADSIANAVVGTAETVAYFPDLVGDRATTVVGAGEAPAPALPLDDFTGVPQIAVALGVAWLGSGIRGGYSPSASMVFTNVRLIPCIVADTVHRMVPAVTGATGGTSAATGSSKPTTERSRAGSGLIDDIREGFDRGARRVVPDDDGDGLRDSRLLTQLGIVLGLVYVAFLTVWFWATRMRWNPRRPV